MLDFEEYKKAFVKRATEKHKDSIYINTCLAYAKTIIENGCPVIYDTKNFSLLVGYKESYILKAITHSTKKYYWTFYIPKKDGTKREITEPLPSLKEIQLWILNNILYKLQSHKFAKAYIPGKKLRDNVKFHTNKKFVITFDIHNFFGSIKRDSIEQIFYKIGYSNLISNLLSKLCTLDGALPQGAPTSPYLSNLFMKDFDERLKKYCEGKKIMYTRYADDLTFSSNNLDIKALEDEVKSAVHDKGLQLNAKKTHIMRYDHRQIVTGIVVNQRTRLPKEERKRLRLVMHYIYLNGLTKHIKNENIDKLNYGRYLLGKVNYALSLEPSNIQYRNFKIFLMKEIFSDYKRRFKHLRLENMQTIKEVEVIKLPDSYIEYITETKEEPKRINNMTFCWNPNYCHQNSILLDNLLKQQKNEAGLSFGIVEGIVVTIDGLAYEHFWNYVKLGKEISYYDVTRDCFQKAQIRAIDRRYYPVNILSSEDLIERRSKGEHPFSEITEQYINEYYKQHPDAYNKYCDLKRKLNQDK